MAGEMAQINSAVLSEKLNNIEALVTELKGMIVAVDARLRAVETNEVGCRAVSDQKLNAAHNRIDDLAGRVKMLETYLPVVRIMAWAGPVFGVALLSLLWALITGQATLAFK